MRLVIQTANKVKQVIYGSIEGPLNTLLATSNSKVAKLSIDMDPSMTCKKKCSVAGRIADAARGSHARCRVSLLAYTGSKDSTQLDDVRHLVSPRSDGEHSDDDVLEQSNAEIKQQVQEITDIRYLMPNHMPQYLRIDSDIKEGLLRLQELMKEYSNFDVLALERDVTRTLELELDKQSADYKRHNRTTEKRLAQAAEKIENCILLKDQIIQTRMQEIKMTKQTYDACRNF